MEATYTNPWPQVAKILVNSTRQTIQDKWDALTDDEREMWRARDAEMQRVPTNRGDTT